ncbi:hypothetical protein B0J11DRAFT_71493 [Dendryphion nanum]|uniref:Uncharacterized protein n=1 Tax=Dendryphion nanum TaxID=256645 RepID=A0A9P9DI32_9PLEO|nr:hypothetical protein B0J11DRAFT_71493 [Dendryphion nanum]
MSQRLTVDGEQRREGERVEMCRRNERAEEKVAQIARAPGPVWNTPKVDNFGVDLVAAGKGARWGNVRVPRVFNDKWFNHTAADNVGIVISVVDECAHTGTNAWWNEAQMMRRDSTTVPTCAKKWLLFGENSLHLYRGFVLIVRLCQMSSVFALKRRLFDAFRGRRSLLTCNFSKSVWVLNQIGNVSLLSKIESDHISHSISQGSQSVSVA